VVPAAEYPEGERGDAWEPCEDRQGAGAAEEPGPASASFGFLWEPIDSAAFAAANYQAEWHVRRILAGNQPGVVGGPYKVLKTSIAIDLGVSIAFALPWLGVFECPRPRRVAILSGESGAFTLQETARRVCAAKGVDLADLKDNLFWQFTLPQFSKQEQLERLYHGLVKDRIEVLITDPLYLSLLAGGDVRAENLFEMGPLFLNIATTCQRAGTTPVLCHHTKKGAGKEGEPLELSDLAYSGVAELARQWLLLSRRRKYEPGTGRHELWLNVGGSAGQGGLWAVDVDEGVIGDDFQGRKWEVKVQSRAQSREAMSAEVERKQAQKVREDGSKVLKALDELANEEGIAGHWQVRVAAHLGNDAMLRAVLNLVQNGYLEEVPLVSLSGKNMKTKKEVQGLRRVTHTTDGTVGPGELLDRRYGRSKRRQTVRPPDGFVTGEIPH
jgi:hypothetical protein